MDLRRVFEDDLVQQGLASGRESRPGSHATTLGFESSLTPHATKQGLATLVLSGPTPITLENRWVSLHFPALYYYTSSEEKRAEGVLSLNGAVFNAIKSKRRLSMVLKNGRSLVFKPALVAELPQWQQAFQVAGVAPAAVSAKPRGSSSSSQSRLVSPTSHEADEESPPPTSGSLDTMLDYLVATKLSFEIFYATTLVVRQMYHTQFQDYELIQAAAVSIAAKKPNRTILKFHQERLFLFLKLWAEDPNHVPSIEARHELARLVSTALSKSQASALKWMTLKTHLRATAQQSLTTSCDDSESTTAAKRYLSLFTSPKRRAPLDHMSNSTGSSVSTPRGSTPRGSTPRAAAVGSTGFAATPRSPTRSLAQSTSVLMHSPVISTTTTSTTTTTATPMTVITTRTRQETIVTTLNPLKSRPPSDDAIKNLGGSGGLGGSAAAVTVTASAGTSSTLLPNSSFSFGKKLSNTVSSPNLKNSFRTISDLRLRRRSTFLETTSQIDPKSPREQQITSALICVKKSLLAEHLTLVDVDLYATLSLSEFRNQAWSKDNKEELSPTICAIANQFNRVAAWVTADVLHSYDSRDTHLTTFKHYIRLAKRTLNLNNFGTTAAIVAGLNNIAVQRLRAIKFFESDEFEKLDHIFDGRDNYKVYRELFFKRPYPRLPFLAVLLRDLTFIDDGNPSWNDEDKQVVNFIKWFLTANTIKNLGLHEPACLDYKFARDEFVLQVMKDFFDKPMMSDEGLYQLSLQLEPPRTRISHRISEDSSSSSGSPRVPAVMPALSIQLSPSNSPPSPLLGETLGDTADLETGVLELSLGSDTLSEYENISTTLELGVNSPSATSSSTPEDDASKAPPIIVASAGSGGGSSRGSVPRLSQLPTTDPGADDTKLKSPTSGAKSPTAGTRSPSPSTSTETGGPLPASHPLYARFLEKIEFEKRRIEILEAQYNEERRRTGKRNQHLLQQLENAREFLAALEADFESAKL